MPQKKDKTSSHDYPLYGRMMLEASEKEVGCKPSPGLYIVATPIGNLGDISLRALLTLKNTDLILCEDTRTSGVLMHAYGIKRPLVAYHDHNADSRRPEVMKRLSESGVVALISDAGMPVIADPGFKLVRECRGAGIDVTVIPGANAAVTALAGCGLPTDKFLFAGFLPAKTVARKKEILLLKTAAMSLVFYESPQRLVDCLRDLGEVLGASRPAAVARELTKFFEETRLGTLSELEVFYAANPAKGEIVIIVGANTDAVSIDIDSLLRDRMKHLSVRDAVSEVAEMTGGIKKEIYTRALRLLKSKKT